MCSFPGQLFWKVISGKGPKNLCTAKEKDFFKHWLLLWLWSWNSENNTSQKLPRGQRSNCPFKKFNFPIENSTADYLPHAPPDHSLPFCPELPNANRNILQWRALASRKFCLAGIPSRSSEEGSEWLFSGLLPQLKSVRPYFLSSAWGLYQLCCFNTASRTASLGVPLHPHTFVVNPFISEPSLNYSDLRVSSASYGDTDW